MHHIDSLALLKVINNWGSLHLPITLNIVQNLETNSLYSAFQLFDYDRSTTELEQVTSSSFNYRTNDSHTGLQDIMVKKMITRAVVKVV